jgi:hypothetical protein
VVCPDWGEESLHWNDGDSVGEQNVLPVVDGGDGKECADFAAGVSTTIVSAAVPAMGRKGVGGTGGLEALTPASRTLSSKGTLGVLSEVPLINSLRNGDCDRLLLPPGLGSAIIRSGVCDL